MKTHACLAEIDALSAPAERSPLEGAKGPNAAEIWGGLDRGRSEIVRTLVNVAVLNQPPGRRPDGSYFGPEFVEITPVGTA